MKNWTAALLGLVVGLAIVPLVAAGYFYMGMAPVATESKPMPFETFFAKKALHALIRREAPANSPVPADEPNLLGGAQLYREDCAVCHGLPGQALTPIAGGMFPKPPQLFKGKGVTDDSVGETYWKVCHGIRLSGMPSFCNSLSETQIWQVSQLLAVADKLPQSVQTELSRGLAAATANGVPSR